MTVGITTDNRSQLMLVAMSFSVLFILCIELRNYYFNSYDSKDDSYRLNGRVDEGRLILSKNDISSWLRCQ